MEERIYSFAGGPTMLPRSILEKIKNNFLNYDNSGVPLFELDPQSKQFNQIHQQAKDTVRDLLNVPQNYKVWFCPAGAHFHFGAFPMNLLRNKTTANYTKTGYFSRLAVQQAEKVCKVNVIATLQLDQNGKKYVPDVKDYNIDPNGSYIHYIDNETVQGVQYNKNNIPTHEDQFVLNDCSSNFLTKYIDWNKIDAAYAHTQKNCGISGTTIMIIDEKLTKLPKLPQTPYVCNYENFEHGFPTTQMTFAIYANYLMLNFIKETGGVSYYQQNSYKRCKKLYDIIDNSHGVYRNEVRKDWRSRINVTWRTSSSDIQAKCLAQGAKNGLFEFKGHRSTGGFRASLFIPVPDEGVNKLADFLSDFMIKYQ